MKKNESINNEDLSNGSSLSSIKKQEAKVSQESITKEEKSLSKKKSSYDPEETTDIYSKARQVCISIFLYYSTFSFEENDFVISTANVNKLFKRVKIISNENLKQYEFEILLKQCFNNKKSLPSQDFLNFLLQTSAKLYPAEFETDPQATLEGFIHTFLVDFYNIIVSSKDANPNSIFLFHNNFEERVENVQIESSISAIFNDLYKTFKTVYSAYFIYEANENYRGKNLIKKSLDNLIEFCKEFEISPYFIEVNKIVIIYHIILEANEKKIVDDKKNFGALFTFSKFLFFFFHISLIIFDKLIKSFTSEQFNSISNGEKMLIFLDKLDNGKGLKKLREKFGVMNFNLSFIPSKEAAKAINSEMIESIDISNTLSENSLNKSSDKTTKVDEFEKYSAFLTLKYPELVGLYKQYLEELKSIFEYFSSLGEQLISHQMNFTGFYLFLSKMDLVNSNSQKKVKGNVQKLSENESYSIFTKLTSSKKKFINFGLFLKSFELLSAKIICNNSLSQKERLLTFFTKHVLTLITQKKIEERSNQNIYRLLELAKDSKISEIMNKLKPYMYEIFKIYMIKQKELLNFSGYCQLLKDFSVFPDIVNLIQVKAIFYALSEKLKEEYSKAYHDLTERSKKTMLVNIYSENFLNFDFFCDSLLICSYYFKNENNTDVENLFFLFRKMTQVSNFNDSKKKYICIFASIKELNIELINLRKTYLRTGNKGQSQNPCLLLKSSTCFDDVFIK